MFEHIIFDYDGVLVDSFEFHLNKYNEFFDIDLTAQELRDAHNGNFYDNKTEKLSLQNISGYVDLVAPFQETLPLRDGVQETLAKLSETKHIHLVTSAWERQCLPNLQYHHIDKYFIQLMFADSGFAKHDKMKKIIELENTASEKCLFVADTLGDIHEANMLSIKTVALVCGFHARETIEQGEPTYTCTTWDELNTLLSNL